MFLIMIDRCRLLMAYWALVSFIFDQAANDGISVLFICLLFRIEIGWGGDNLQTLAVRALGTERRDLCSQTCCQTAIGDVDKMGQYPRHIGTRCVTTHRQKWEHQIKSCRLATDTCVRFLASNIFFQWRQFFVSFFALPYSCEELGCGRWSNKWCVRFCAIVHSSAALCLIFFFVLYQAAVNRTHYLIEHWSFGLCLSVIHAGGIYWKLARSISFDL